MADWPRPASSATTSGTIYQAHRDMRLFEDRTARRVGDTVVIRLIESTAATKSATTSVNKSSNINLENPILFGASFGNPLLAESKNNYATTISGEREAGRRRRQRPEQQPDRQCLRCRSRRLSQWQSGHSRRKNADPQPGRRSRANLRRYSPRRHVGADNTILSSQVADAKITYAGNGALADANTVSWLGRFFLSPLWPF
jgi:flagellar L-ring protein precursor FlgH